MKTFDVVVIGSGPGGYVAAIRCAQLGMKTALVEKYNSLGGTCLNVGCIPSKALLDSSHLYEESKHNFEKHGIDIKGDISINFEQMISRKNEVISQTVEGINYLMNKNKIEIFNGIGSFINSTEISVKLKDGFESIQSKHFIIATGSKPNSLPSITLDKKRIITSTEALSLKEIPAKLVIIGGGVIGLELGQVYNRLGTEVEVIEYAKSIIPTMDSSLSKELQKVLKKQGIKFKLSHQVTTVNSSENKVTVKALDKKGEEVTIEGDYCLVSVGRKPYTEHLNLEKANIDTDTRGFIKVDTHCRTNISNIYAIGDVVGGQMLAHKASEEGTLVAEIIANQKPHINYNLIPGVVYTWPEVASVGKTEEQLKEEKVTYKKGQFPMRALGRSRASMDIDGFVKILSDSTTDEVLGVHIIGARAADLIAEAVVAMEYRASAEDIARISHAHPTYSEAMKEAALDASEKRPIHS